MIKSIGDPLTKLFLKVVADPQNIGRMCEIVGEMPNIETQTLGGKVFWETLVEKDGWKLQKNKLTEHCRIIDPKNVRKAWGSEQQLKKLLSDIVY